LYVRAYIPILLRSYIFNNGVFITSYLHDLEQIYGKERILGTRGETPNIMEITIGY
jgi:hypothetical protein